MIYTETLLGYALKDECPGCGPTLEYTYDPVDSHIIAKHCTCCGWMVLYEIGLDGKPVNASFQFMPPSIDDVNQFDCVIAHPEHRANWPQPEKDKTQPDTFTPLEQAQETLRLDGNHYYLINPEKKCGTCEAWAAHKISEERPNFYGHPYTSALCCRCFEKVFGPLSHRYEKVLAPVIIQESSGE